MPRPTDPAEARTWRACVSALGGPSAVARLLLANACPATRDTVARWASGRPRRPGGEPYRPDWRQGQVLLVASSEDAPDAPVYVPAEKTEVDHD